MSQSSFLKYNFGKKTVLTIKVALTCSIMTFLCALLCYYYLEIKGVIFYALLIYSLANLLNLAIFFKHKRLVVTYNIMSFLAFLVTYITCLYNILVYNMLVYNILYITCLYNMLIYSMLIYSMLIYNMLIYNLYNQYNLYNLHNLNNLNNL